jgi:UDPglucose 6-dehydrogenase
LAFKPNTDDVREAPALQVARAMLKEGAVIHAYDPVAMDEARKGLPEITCCSSIVEAVDKADMVLIMTEWNEFRDLPLETIKSVLRTPVFYDTRNIYDPARVRKLGFTYLSTGRP